MNIIEMTEQAGFNEDFAHLYVDFMTRFAALVRAAALDEAAGVCDEYDEGWYVYRKGAAQCATAIRQLKETK